MGNDEDRVQTQIDAGIHEKEVIINFLQTNPKGRLLFNSIAFQIANYFKTHPEKITHELVCGIIRAVKQTKIK